MAIFIDSSVFVAYGNLDDFHHEKSVRIMDDTVSGKYGKAFTSDYIFDESVTVALARTKDPGKAVELGDIILNSEFSLLSVSDTIFQEAWTLFRKENRQKMSFTDLTNIAFMKTYGIDYIASFDGAFRKFGGIDVVG